MKKCTRCRVEQPLQNFCVNRAKKDGLNPRCRSCAKSGRDDYYRKNQEASRLASQKWHSENRDRRRASAKSWRESKRTLTEEQKAATVGYNHAYYEANKERLKAQAKVWALANPEAVKRNAYASVRRRQARKVRATPEWADQAAIKAVYDECFARRKTGEDVEVDHLVPLKSTLVCGLHVPANLQVLESSKNRSKSNRYWPDMP